MRKHLSLIVSALLLSFGFNQSTLAKDSKNFLVKNLFGNNLNKRDSGYENYKDSNLKLKNQGSLTLMTNWIRQDIVFKNLIKNNISNINQLIQRKAITNKGSTITSIGYADIFPIIISKDKSLLKEICNKNPKILTQQLDVFGNNLLHLIVAVGWKEGLSYILKNYGNSTAITNKNNNRITPIQLAHYLGQSEIFNILKKHSNYTPYPNGKNHDKLDKDLAAERVLGFNLAVIVILNKNLPLLKELYKRDKHLFSREIDTFGNTMLHIMAAVDWIDGIEFMHHNSNASLINMKNKNGFTPCHIAASMFNYMSCDRLLDFSNFNPNVKSKLGSPLHIAIRNYGLYTFEKNDAINTVWTLCGFRNQNGSFLNVTDNDGRTPLHLAAIIGKSRFAIYAMRAGGDPRIRNRYGKYPYDVVGEGLYRVDKQHLGSLQKLLRLESYKNGRDYMLRENETNHKYLKDLIERKARNLDEFCCKPY